MLVTQAQADKFGISFSELQTLVAGKQCSVYPNEILHVRRGRGGKVTVFNTSEKARSEKIKATKAAKKASLGTTATAAPAFGSVEASI